MKRLPETCSNFHLSGSGATGATQAVFPCSRSGTSTARSKSALATNPPAAGHEVVNIGFGGRWRLRKLKARPTRVSCDLNEWPGEEQVQGGLHGGEEGLFADLCGGHKADLQQDG